MIGKPGGVYLSSGRKKKKEKAMNPLLSISLYFLAVIAATFILNSFVITRDVVLGDSMADTLNDGDVVMLDLISYRFSSPKRWDLVVFPAPDRPDSYMVKRIVGLPGETVRIDEEGNLFINERQQNDSHATEITEDPGLASGRGVTLASDEFFVLGDNRNHSMDSRSPQVRNVKKEKIRGRVFLRILPFKDFGKVK